MTLPATPGKIRYSRISWWLLAFLFLCAGIELFRFVHNLINMHFLLSIATPWQIWGMVNLAFSPFMLSTPIIIGYLIRSRWAPLWNIRLLLLITSAGFLRSLLLGNFPIAAYGRIGFALQLLLLALLLILLIRKAQLVKDE